MFFSWPKVFLAADSIASSSALTMMSRSMPFSLLTCSMTRFRSGSMAPSSPHGSALGRLTTQGETLDEARDMAKDAILSSLEALREDGEEVLQHPIPSVDRPDPHAARGFLLYRPYVNVTSFLRMRELRGWSTRARATAPSVPAADAPPRGLAGLRAAAADPDDGTRSAAPRAAR